MVVAMAGFAEAAEFYGLLFVAGVLLVIAGLLALAWWKQSMIAAMLALGLLILPGLIMQPWTAFDSPTSDDPDEAYWLVQLRVASMIWGIFVAAAAGCMATVIRRKRGQRLKAKVA